MKQALPLITLLAAIALPGCDVTTAEPTHPVFADGKHHGMSYAHGVRRAEMRGYGSEASLESLRLLKELGVNWISITPFGFQASPLDASIRWGGTRLSETDDRLVAVTRQAHELGIKVMLKPHIWLRSPSWVGEVRQDTEEGWSAWFEAYREFILHYARLAAEARMDAFCIGNELEKTTTREREWRETIARIRDAYPGALTYGAGGDVFAVPFWDALDFIGLSAYFPLVNEATPSRAALVSAWQPYIRQLADLSARWNRPIVFTELGYRSADYAAWRQWEVQRRAPVNLAAQAEAYAAFFDAVWSRPWFAGVYWWKWFSYPDDGGPENNDYTPRNKPAEAILKEFYSRAAAQSSAP